MVSGGTAERGLTLGAADGFAAADHNVSPHQVLARARLSARCIFVTCAAVACLAGCTTYRYTEYGAKEPDKFYGTQPGYHKLSDHFSVETSDYLMRFHFLGLSKTEKQNIGILKVRWYDRSDYGPRQMAYAISQDGRRLLFFDEPGADQGKPLRTKDSVVVADLYFFDADRGHRELLQRDVHRRGIGVLSSPRTICPMA
jgi:hypothetical protein